MRSRAIRMGVLAAMSSWIVACGGDDGEDTPSNGDNMCPSLEACGGDPVGDWTIDDICVTNPRTFFASTVGVRECADALKKTSGIEGSGMYRLTAEKMAVSTLVVTATADFEFSDACVKALGVADSAASECSKIQDELTKDSSMVKGATCTASGANCNCTVMSAVSFAANASYTVEANSIKVQNLDQPFCVQGSTMKLKATSSGVTATLDLSK